MHDEEDFEVYVPHAIASFQLTCYLVCMYMCTHESVVLRIAAFKRALESAKVKLRNNVPQTSSAVTAITRVDSLFCVHAQARAWCTCGHTIWLHTCARLR